MPTQPKTDIRVFPFQPEDAARWDQFVGECPEATFFHRAGWKSVIERAFGHDTHYLIAEADGQVRGILPLVHIKSLLFGHSLSSTPFCVYGGVAATSPQARAALEDAACTLAGKLGVGYLEMRNREARRSDWKRKDLYVTFRKEIHADPERNMAEIPRKQRAMVRKGIKAGLASRIDGDIDTFYGNYSESVRNLGTPVFAKKYFRLLKEEFGDDCEVLTVTLEDRPITSVMSFYFRDEVLPYYGGGIAEGRRLKSNDFMYWELMRRAGESGVRIFDYGRSKQGTGSYSFKKNWGFEPEPLHYEFFLVKARQVPDVNPLNPKYKLFIELWSRLPLPVSQVLGPVLSRNLG